MRRMKSHIPTRTQPLPNNNAFTTGPKQWSLFAVSLFLSFLILMT